MQEILSKSELEEINQLATIGLQPDEHEEYQRRVDELSKKRRNLKWQNFLAPDLQGEWEGS